jgi:predicted DNA-binding transcriptional regulator AlpA
MTKHERPQIGGSEADAGETSVQSHSIPPARPNQAPIEPLAFRKRTAADLVGISVRTLERLASAGKFPRPDAHAGKCPLWTRSTLEAWISRGGSK